MHAIAVKRVSYSHRGAKSENLKGTVIGTRHYAQNMRQPGAESSVFERGKKRKAGTKARNVFKGKSFIHVQCSSLIEHEVNRW